jgi:hypothetical protein
MPKNSDRTVRTLRREAVKHRRLLAQTHQNVIRSVEKASNDHNASANLLKRKEDVNRQLRQHLASFQTLFTQQQRIIREQQTRLVHLQRGHNKWVNGQRAAERETNDVAVAMIAMSQQCCRTCLGSGSVLKTKRNIRYSVECKQCK